MQRLSELSNKQEEYTKPRSLTRGSLNDLGDDHSGSPGEEFRPVPGWEGLYEVSSLGRIKSLPRTVLAKGRKPYVRPERFMSLQADRYGYKYCDLTRDAKHHRRSVHVLVAQAWHGPKPEEGMGALHRNGIESDNRPENLYWGTPKQNYEDAVRHGRYTRDRGKLCSA